MTIERTALIETNYVELSLALPKSVGSGHRVHFVFGDSRALHLWTALPLQVDFEKDPLWFVVSGTRWYRGAQMGNPLAHASTAGRPRRPR
jgi:hypothetical protein